MFKRDDVQIHKDINQMRILIKIIFFFSFGFYYYLTEQINLTANKKTKNETKRKEGRHLSFCIYKFFVL